MAWCDHCKAEKPGWISVKTRLPKFDQVVQVCYKSGYDDGPLYTYGARLWDSEGWLWGIKDRYGGIEPGRDANCNDIAADDDYRVTHWMPLARPPFKKPKKKQQPAVTAAMSENGIG